MNNKSLHIFLLVFTVATALCGCNRKTIYHHYEHVPVAAWDRQDTLHFSIAPITRRTVSHREVQLRVTEQYPYQNLCLIIEQTTYPSQRFRCDTLMCSLVPVVRHLAETNGISMHLYQFPLRDISINEGDSLQINIRHGMKREMLPGIADIGIKLSAY